MFVLTRSSSCTFAGAQAHLTHTYTHILSIYTLSERGGYLCFCAQMSQDQNISARLVSML